MSSNTSARSRFRALIRRPEAQFDLIAVALCVAEEDQPGADIAAAGRELAALTEGARARLSDSGMSPNQQLAALNRYLFDEIGFRGNTWRYNDPANSFLDQVLLRRAGLPITLAVIYIELGQRLGLPLSGVALPGHFLVRYSAPDGDIYIDPFQQGRMWSREECEQQIINAYGVDARPLTERIMQPPARRAILARMLRNLKNAYVEAEDFAKALSVIERLLLLDTRDAGEIRDRGVLRANLGMLHLALDDLDTYAKTAPDAPDLPVLRARATAIGKMIAVVN